jgi:fatty acid desaturase
MTQPTPSTETRRRTCLILLLVTIPLGIGWRTAPLHLSPFLFKYGGSALWAIAVYWLIAAILPRRAPIQIAVLAAILAAALEFSRLCHLPALDAFRLTLPGKLLAAAFLDHLDLRRAP